VPADSDPDLAFAGRGRRRLPDDDVMVDEVDGAGS
jgi:hypothetical protein